MGSPAFLFDLFALVSFIFLYFWVCVKSKRNSCRHVNVRISEYSNNRISENSAPAPVCVCTDRPTYIKIPETSIPPLRGYPSLKIPYLLHKKKKTSINKVYYCTFLLFPKAPGADLGNIFFIFKCMYESQMVNEHVIQSRAMWGGYENRTFKPGWSKMREC